jgi:hypothetical protein
MPRPGSRLPGKDMESSTVVAYAGRDRNRERPGADDDAVELGDTAGAPESSGGLALGARHRIEARRLGLCEWSGSRGVPPLDRRISTPSGLSCIVTVDSAPPSRPSVGCAPS